MFFTTDVNKVFQIKDPKEYLKGERREILPQLARMVKNATTIIKETFDVDVLEIMAIKKSHSSLTSGVVEFLIKNSVTCGLVPKTLQEGYRNLPMPPQYRKSLFRKTLPLSLKFCEWNRRLEVRLELCPYNEIYYKLVGKFFFDNWKHIRDFLPFILEKRENEAEYEKNEEYEKIYQREDVVESYVNAWEIEDIDAYFELSDKDSDDWFWNDFTLVVPPVELPEGITDIRDLEDGVRDKILRFYETSFAYLYPFLHVCICLAKGESTDSFFVMLEKLKHLYKQAEKILPDSITYPSPAISIVKSSTDEAKKKATDDTDEFYPDEVIFIKEDENAEDAIDSDLEELDSLEIEGDDISNTGTRRTRSQKARKVCIRHHGSICVVCDFDFEKRYGKIGEGFIHVHHLEDVASKDGKYAVNPKKDLRPVCPNCHAMLHKRKPAMDIDELRNMLKDDEE